MLTQKAAKATIKLGAIELDCYQMPDGAYRYSQTQAFISISDEGYDTKQAAKRYIEIGKSQQAQNLLGRELQPGEICKYDGGNESVRLISQTDITDFWLVSALLGHSKAVLLLGAVAQEALERRADSAFGVVRSEEDRNEFIKTRLLGKAKRRTLTDAIKTWIDSHPDQASENYCKFIYSNCSDHLNLVVLGMKAKQARLELECPKGLLRDALPEKALNELATVEEIACRIIEHEDLEPLEAVKKSVTIHYTKTIGIK